MQFLFDFFPLILFFATFKFYGIFVATGAAVVASLVQVSWLKLSGRKIEPMHWITLGAIVILGTATIVLADEVFIRWKPTVVYWIFSGILFGTHLWGNKTAIERVMGSKMEMPAQAWRTMNLSFGVFTLAMGILNLYVAFIYGADLDPDTQREHWVNFKVFGTLVLTFVFVFFLMLVVSRHVKSEEAEGDS